MTNPDDLPPRDIPEDLVAYALIGATIPAHAYEITAPPEIVSAAKLSAELSRDVMDFGPRCRSALIYDLDDKTPCDIIGKIAAQMIEPANTVHAWLKKVQGEGATTVVNMPAGVDRMNEATEMLGTLMRLNSYGDAK